MHSFFSVSFEMRILLTFFPFATCCVEPNCYEATGLATKLLFGPSPERYYLKCLSRSLSLSLSLLQSLVEYDDPSHSEDDDGVQLCLMSALVHDLQILCTHHTRTHACTHARTHARTRLHCSSGSNCHCVVFTVLLPLPFFGLCCAV